MVAAVVTAALSHILIRALSHTGIVTVAVRMIIPAIAPASVGVLSAQCTPLHMADPDHAAGTVAIAVLMSISAIGLTVVGVISRLRTPFHRTYADRPAGTVTVAAPIFIKLHLLPGSFPWNTVSELPEEMLTTKKSFGMQVLNVSHILTIPPF